MLSVRNGFTVLTKGNDEVVIHISPEDLYDRVASRMSQKGRNRRHILLPGMFRNRIVFVKVVTPNGSGQVNFYVPVELGAKIGKRMGRHTLAELLQAT